MSSNTMTNNPRSVKLPISVTIICCNEIERIKNTIESVQEWVDDIVVIDSGSTDGTIELVERMGVRIIHNPWPGYGMQKKFAEGKAKNDWILNLDSDEEILPELRDEIILLFTTSETKFDAYKIRILDRFLCTRELSSYVLHNYVRLYRKSKYSYSTSTVHDSVLISDQSQVGQLKKNIAHDAMKSFRHRIEKMNEYTDAQVIDLQKKGRASNKFRIILEPFWTFIVCYFVRGYFKNGLMGYIYSINFSYSRFLRQIKLYELEMKQKRDT